MRKLDSSVCLCAFGGFIKAARKKKRYTQKDVGDMVGIHQSYYGLIERAQREVDLATAIKICKALEIDLADFIKTQM